MAFIRQEKPTKNRDLLNLGLLVFNIMKTTLKVTQSTSRPPRIVGHVKKVDPSLLDDENRIRQSQDMLFFQTCKTDGKSRLPENGITFVQLNKNDT